MRCINTNTNIEHKLKQVYKRLTHTHTGRSVFGSCNSTGIQCCFMFPFAPSACLLIHLPQRLTSSLSVLIPTVTFGLCVCSCIFSPSACLSLLACLSVALCPKLLHITRGTFLSAPRTESSLPISHLILSTKDESKSRGILLYLSLVIPLPDPQCFHPSFFFFVKCLSFWKTNHSVHISQLPTSPLPHSLPPASTVPQLLVLIAAVSMWAGNITIPNERERIFLSSLFFSFNIALPSLTPCLLISQGTGVWVLKEERTSSFSSLYKRFWWHSHHLPAHISALEKKSTREKLSLCGFNCTRSLNSYI